MKLLSPLSFLSLPTFLEKKALLQPSPPPLHTYPSDPQSLILQYCLHC